MDSIKVLEIIDSLSPGGGERFVVDLSNEMSKTVNVSLASFRDMDNGDFYVNEINENVHYYHYKGKQTIISKFKQLIFIVKLISKIKPNIVHGHLTAFNYIIIPFFLFRKIKFYFTVHNLAEKDTNSKLQYLLKRWMFKSNIRPITISKQCEESFINLFSFPSFHKIGNGCRQIETSSKLNSALQEINNLKTDQNTKVFLSIGRLVEQKNFELLIKSFDEISENTNSILLIIGDDVKYFKKKIELQKLVKNNRVYFLGVKNNISDYLYFSDFFCLSSKWEGLPISLLEAGLSGVYPICTPVGGIPDVIISDDWGKLSLDLSVESYQKALLSSIENNKNKNDLKHLYSNRFLIDKCCEKYLKAFSS